MLMSEEQLDILARMTSWEFIIENKIQHLPVNPQKLCVPHNIRILTYQNFSDLIGNTVCHIKRKYNPVGFCLFYERQYYIVYNAAVTDRGVIRVTFAHELAHIVLGHIGPSQPYLKHIHILDSREEMDAKKFAHRLLCPSIVLHLCGVSSPAELQQLCDVPLDLAQLRWEHLQELRKTKAFLIKPEERAVMNQFAEFICHYVAEKFDSP